MAEINLEKRVSRNHSIFKIYNEKRKALFKEISPKESQLILEVLPWLLCINHKNCPGYLPDFNESFTIFGIEQNRDIKAKASSFNKFFSVDEKELFYLYNKRGFVLEGIYTIGSIGSIAQTAYSDCDIWICFDFEKLGKKGHEYLIKKINIIKDWFDENCKIPVYFFICELKDIKNGYFGKLDKESSGSAQKNLLMEEFYRTTIVIAGKTPFWWVCFGQECSIGYEDSLAKIREGLDGGIDYIDFGNIPEIKADEFLGASLWQLQKAFASPIKSVIKMALLIRSIVDPNKNIAADIFRELILSETNEEYYEPMVFTMDLLLSSLDSFLNENRFNFLKECFFLRCDIKVFDKKTQLRKNLIDNFLKILEISKNDQVRLSSFSNWDMSSQVLLGKRLVQELFDFYRIISSFGQDCPGINKRDLTVLGRKLAAIYQRKKNKIQLIPKPLDQFNLIDVTFVYSDNHWYIYAGRDRAFELYKGQDIVKAVAFGVWNDLLHEGRVLMEPNSTSISLQEIINLSRKLKAYFGRCDVLDNSPSFYLRPEKVQKVFIVVSFEESIYEKNINNFAIIYKTTWGELFATRVNSPFGLQRRLKIIRDSAENFDIEFYLQRNSSYYEKIIRRTRDIIENAFVSSM